MDSRHSDGVARLKALMEDARGSTSSSPSSIGGQDGDGATGVGPPSESSEQLSTSGTGSDDPVLRTPKKKPAMARTPFIPPQFPSPSDGNTLIRPSEYLRTIAARQKTPVVALRRNSKADSLPVSHEDLSNLGDDDRASSSSSSTTSNDSGIVTSALPLIANLQPTLTSVPPPPPPPEVIISEPTATTSVSGSSTTSSNALPTSAIVSPLANIKEHDLQAVKLRKIEKSERFDGSVAPSGGLRNAFSSENLLETRSNLIEELTRAKNIQGIKKLKEERAKQDQEMEKKRRAELNKQFNSDNFIEIIPDVDSSGQPIAPWKRQMLAKKAADKAKKEAELQRLREEENRKNMTVPAWKRQLNQQKKDINVSNTSLSKDNNNARVPDVKLPNGSSTLANEKPKVMVQMQHLKSDPVLPSPNQAEDDGSSASKDVTDKPPNPWKCQLRPTNSKLLKS